MSLVTRDRNCYWFYHIACDIWNTGNSYPNESHFTYCLVTFVNEWSVDCFSDILSYELILHLNTTWFCLLRTVNTRNSVLAEMAHIAVWKSVGKFCLMLDFPMSLLMRWFPDAFVRLRMLGVVDTGLLWLLVLALSSLHEVCQ